MGNILSAVISPKLIFGPAVGGPDVEAFIANGVGRSYPKGKPDKSTSARARIRQRFTGHLNFDDSIVKIFILQDGDRFCFLHRSYPDRLFAFVGGLLHGNIDQLKFLGRKWDGLRPTEIN